MRELAERLGVSPGTVNAIEHGQTGISVQRLSDLARAFDVSAATLLDSVQGPATTAPSSGNWRSFSAFDGDTAISAAISAFVEAGYHGSSMRTIAERAGMSLANVYHYYPSKQALLIRILDVAMDELEWRCSAATSGIAEPLDKLYRLVESLALFHTVRADIAYIGASEMRSIEQPERSRIAERRSGIQYLVDREILRAIADGSATCERPHETGRAIATMCTSLPQWFDQSGPTPPAEIAETYGELAIRMVGASPDLLTRRSARPRTRKGRE